MVSWIWTNGWTPDEYRGQRAGRLILQHRHAYGHTDPAQTVVQSHDRAFAVPVHQHGRPIPTLHAQYGRRAERKDITRVVALPKHHFHRRSRQQMHAERAVWIRRCPRCPLRPRGRRETAKQPCAEPMVAIVYK